MSVSELKDRLGIEHSHGSKTSAVVVGLTLVVALYAAWIFADLLPRIVTLVIAGVLTGLVLYRETNAHLVTRRALYMLGLLVAITPLMMVLSDALSGLSSTVFVTMTFVFILIFVVLGLIIAGVGYYIGGRAKN